MKDLFDKNEKDNVLFMKKVAKYKLKKYQPVTNLEQKILNLKTSDFNEHGEVYFPIEDVLINRNHDTLRMLESIDNSCNGWLKSQLISNGIAGSITVIGRCYPVDTIVYTNEEMNTFNFKTWFRRNK